MRIKLAVWKRSWSPEDGWSYVLEMGGEVLSYVFGSDVRMSLRILVLVVVSSSFMVIVEWFDLFSLKSYVLQ